MNKKLILAILMVVSLYFISCKEKTTPTPTTTPNNITTTKTIQLTAPTLVIPQNGAIGLWTPIVFSWTSVENASKYALSAVCYTSKGSPYGFTSTTVSTNSYTFSDNLSTGFYKQVVYWKVCGIDSKGNYGPYSPTYSFTLKAQ